MRSNIFLFEDVVSVDVLKLLLAIENVRCDA